MMGDLMLIITYCMCVGKYYVVDAGYPNRPGYLAPYKGERYHLPEWHRGMEPNTPKEKFNRVHSSIRNVIERSFGVLKMKWQILYKMPGYSMLTQKKLLLPPWLFITSFVNMQVRMRILQILIGIQILLLLSQKDTTNMRYLSMPLMDQHWNQAL